MANGSVEQRAKPVVPKCIATPFVSVRYRVPTQVCSHDGIARIPFAQRTTNLPHTLRHTTAMHLLQSGVDLAVIAIWLGHESTTTTHMYVEADLVMKQKALERLN